MDEIIIYDINVPYRLLQYGEFIEERGQVFRTDNVKCYVHSNEKSNHHLPHVHIRYKNMEFVVTIYEEIKVIEPKKVSKSLENFLVNLVIQKLPLCINAWNMVESHIKI